MIREGPPRDALKGRFEYSSAANPAGVPDPQTVRRDSRGAMAVARTRLTEHEARFVREQVGDLVAEFYADDEW